MGLIKVPTGQEPMYYKSGVSLPQSGKVRHCVPAAVDKDCGLFLGGPRFESSLADHGQEAYLTSLSLGSLICKTRVILVRIT